ncbi:uncharacterized protein LOC117613754, partial [Prunus dulcis]|uniref:uncharacterized protein LOC117613754 n=1 Tax=Prunus dulcis TaxID=3755 RepID=UPI001482C084
MERYFKRKFSSTTSSSDNVGSSSVRDVGISRDVVGSSKESELQDVLANLPADPGLRPQMLDYDPNIRDEVRRAYLQKGPCQPKDHTFPQTDLSGISKDAAFCLYCYLFKSNFKIGQGCSDVFTEVGFTNWKKKDKIRQHVGGVGSVHNQSRQYCVDLMNQKQHIQTVLIKQSDQARIDYRICLTASLDCVRFLLKQGLPFRGNDESDTSNNKGNYVELLELSISMLRGQGYDGAIGASCRRRDMLRDQLQKNITEALENDDLPTGRGLNQETSLKRAGDTRWNSHYGTLLSIISMFKSVVKVLKLIIEDGSTDNIVTSITKKRPRYWECNVFSQRLQGHTKDMRDNGFEALLDQVFSFCGKHDIEVPSMDDAYVAQWRSHRRAPRITQIHHYRVDIFIQIIEWQLAELNHRFSEVNTELLICLACLSPNDSFIAFDKQKLLRFAEFYPQEFTPRDLLALEDQLGIYIHHMRTRSEFSQLKGIGALARKMVEKGLHRTFNYVYLLLTLALTLPVATASVERAFSAMNVIKGPLRNRMGDQWLSDSFLVYIEKDVFVCIDNETIMGQMDTVGILVCYNGSWVKKDNIESYEGGEAKGIIVSRNVTFSELVERIYKIMDAEPTKYSVTLKYSVPVSASVSKQIRVEDNDDVQYFLKYNTDVMASK